MKYSRTACTCLIALTTSTTFAFRPSSFLGQSAIARQSSRAVSTTTPTMLLNKLFGGGAFGTERIAYQNLDHPGPELAQWAEQGKMPATSERDPHLALATLRVAVFGGLELAYQRVPGVQYTAVGYAQGPEDFPTYNQVCAGATGHTEAVMVYYDPKECEYSSLLDAFFERTDPTTVNGQGRDFGKQYRTGIYFHTPEQEAIARARFEEEAKKVQKTNGDGIESGDPLLAGGKVSSAVFGKGRTLWNAARCYQGGYENDSMLRLIGNVLYGEV